MQNYLKTLCILLPDNVVFLYFIALCSLYWLNSSWWEGPQEIGCDIWDNLWPRSYSTAGVGLVFELDSVCHLWVYVWTVKWNGWTVCVCMFLLFARCTIGAVSVARLGVSFWRPSKHLSANLSICRMDSSPLMHTQPPPPLTHTL